MTVNRIAPVVSVLALCLGVVLLAGVRPARPVAVLPQAAAASAMPAAAGNATPPATVARAIPAGYRIAIPRVGIDLPIAEGDLERDAVRQETPNDVALHLPGSALPGESGNTYLYAHAREGMFLPLWNARVGDEVRISAPDGRVLRFVVSEVHPRVDPKDVSWAAPTSGERLTLQTSTGPEPGDPRFVVVATPA